MAMTTVATLVYLSQSMAIITAQTPQSLGSLGYSLRSSNQKWTRQLGRNPAAFVGGVSQRQKGRHVSSVCKNPWFAQTCSWSRRSRRNGNCMGKYTSRPAKPLILEMSVEDNNEESSNNTANLVDQLLQTSLQRATSVMNPSFPSTTPCKKTESMSSGLHSCENFLDKKEVMDAEVEVSNLVDNALESASATVETSVGTFDTQSKDIQGDVDTSTLMKIENKQENDETQLSSSAFPDSVVDGTNVLKELAMGRAMRTISPSSLSFGSSHRKTTEKELIQGAIQRSMQTLSSTPDISSKDISSNAEGETSSSLPSPLKEGLENDAPSSLSQQSFVQPQHLDEGNREKNEHDHTYTQENQTDIKNMQKPHVDKRTYLSHPAVTLTALAHALWSSTVKPHVDTVIDATCGNGQDSVALASLLFPKINEKQDIKGGGALICIDIQKEATERTKRALELVLDLPSGSLDDQNLDQNERHPCVSVLQTSHSPLPVLPSNSRVGLVCYNLGYLPGSTTNTAKVQTSTCTTIPSLADAALCLRVGGMLSVMSYPATNEEEHALVQVFVQCLAQFSSKVVKRYQREGYGSEEIMQQLVESAMKQHQEEELSTESKRMLVVQLERVFVGSQETSSNCAVGRDEKPPQQQSTTTSTWRTFVHAPLGRPTSPVLFTATRIK